MKKAMSILALSFISLSAFCQQKRMDLILNETQMSNLFQLIKAGQSSIFDSDQLSAKGAKLVAIFGDSLANAISAQYAVWHPAPPPKKEVPKTDSTSAPKK